MQPTHTTGRPPRKAQVLVTSRGRQGRTDGEGKKALPRSGRNLSLCLSPLCQESQVTTEVSCWHWRQRHVTLAAKAKGQSGSQVPACVNSTREPRPMAPGEPGVGFRRLVPAHPCWRLLGPGASEGSRAGGRGPGWDRGSPCPTAPRLYLSYSSGKGVCPLRFKPQAPAQTPARPWCPVSSGCAGHSLVTC